MLFADFRCAPTGRPTNTHYPHPPYVSLCRPNLCLLHLSLPIIGLLLLMQHGAQSAPVFSSGVASATRHEMQFEQVRRTIVGSCRVIIIRHERYGPDRYFIRLRSWRGLGVLLADTLQVLSDGFEILDGGGVHSTDPAMTWMIAWRNSSEPIMLDAANSPSTSLSA